MIDAKSPDELTKESLELSRALEELRSWSLERKKMLSDLEEFIQQALHSGKMTARRKHELARRDLSERMIATLGLDCSLIKRSILMMHVRERQIRKRLSEIAEQTQETEKRA